MQIEQKVWRNTDGWKLTSGTDLNNNANMVFVFGSRNVIGEQERYDEIRKFYPKAHILFASTSGEIVGDKLYEETIVTTAVFFEHTSLQAEQLNISSFDESYDAGIEIASRFSSDGLVHIFIVSDGHKVNGSELVRGINNVVQGKIPVSGGMAGDSDRFIKTYVGLNCPPEEGKIVAVGFYGDRLIVGHGSKGGWKEFGPERIVTKSAGNVLYELDGESALDLYKKYLGDEMIQELPQWSALLLPLSIRTDNLNHALVRTILAIDEENNAMIFAGDVPQGARVRLMRSNYESIIDGAMNAATDSYQRLDSFSPQLAILISCIGRKIILKQRVDEEIEAVVETFPKDTVIAGFYSYGEISPLLESPNCELHNQTMTITTYAER